MFAPASPTTVKECLPAVGAHGLVSRFEVENLCGAVARASRTPRQAAVQSLGAPPPKMSLQVGGAATGELAEALKARQRPSLNPRVGPWWPELHHHSQD